jgi:IclR helix-turn-helix domain
VKKPKLVKLEARLDADALRILRDVPGVAVEARSRSGGERRDGVLRFGGATERVAVVVKSRANAATAWQLVQQADDGADSHLLLVAGSTTADAREILRRHGVAVVDGLGNAHVELPGLLLHLETRRGRRADGPRAQPPTRLTGKAGITAQALLLGRDREWRVQELAAEAHVSVGLAHRVLARLEAEGLVTSEGAGPKRVRRLTDATALLDLWAEENNDRGVERVRAFRLAREPRELAAAVSGGLRSAGIAHAVTGAAAAARVAPFVTAVPVTEIWVSAVAAPDDLLAAAGAEPAETGHNLVLTEAKGDEPLAFRREVEGIWTVNPVRLFYDLRNDPRRGREQAEALRREVIGF